VSAPTRTRATQWSYRNHKGSYADEERRLAGTHKSNQKRREIADMRRDLHTGRVSIGEVLRNPPACLEERLLFEVLLMGRQIGPEKLRIINIWAMREGVNLAVPLGRASERSREWLAGELQSHGRYQTEAYAAQAQEAA
jgi:hypothetical protein